MKIRVIVLTAVVSLAPAAARADDVVDLHRKVDQLEADLKDLRLRFGKLGASSAARQIRVVDPVFIGAGVQKANSLAMDNETINCPSRSFITAVQILKTGNTVNQIRYACRQLE